MSCRGPPLHRQSEGGRVRGRFLLSSIIEASSWVSVPFADLIQTVNPLERDLGKRRGEKLLCCPDALCQVLVYGQPARRVLRRDARGHCPCKATCGSPEACEWETGRENDITRPDVANNGCQATDVRVSEGRSVFVSAPSRARSLLSAGGGSA